ncbi:MBL fold metallo-hydrolase [Ornithinicoccus hortensis]|uniref:Glyoxylase-like metal-dependent hydrolase (Beta-lactamase superfamily II) n=1 Tax=Ornithinicoccus hortensis TaxID=82346 RepID=A0A542YSK3_9MICO|nr:MBL fold metallo-hydrolase [Ornithinicoccus hortensis]TQL51082.1 glyoxylase-like metal-dependent hydrolase (beta-lactamase superfamily II) [Ornithinicoccus hortensis]
MSSTAQSCHVEPGGPAWLANLGNAIVRKRSVSEEDNNAYLITCRRTGEQLLIDAADRAEDVLDLVDSGSGQLQLVVTTHQHWDHHRALRAVVDRHTPATAAGANDADALPVPPDTRLAHGDTLTVGDLTLDVVALRGHTPGSVALALRDGAGGTHLFTGDSLFPGGPGKTWSPEDFGSLMDDLEARIFGVYPDDTVVHPGHGDSTTLGAERPSLPEWRDRGW